jgi:hypothetical protein
MIEDYFGYLARQFYLEYIIRHLASKQMQEIISSASVERSGEALQ